MISSPLTRYVEDHDAEAFRELVTEYQDLVYGTCHRILRHAHEVDDAVQETFLKLARHANAIHSNVGAWLHSCARTTSLNMLRQRRAHAREIDLKPEAAPTAPEPANADDSDTQVIDDCLNELSELDREVVVSYFFLEKTQEQIANAVGVSREAIKKRLGKVLEILRGKFVRRGLVVPGLVAAFLSDLSAEAKVPALLAEKLASLSPITAPAAHSAKFVAVGAILKGKATLLAIVAIALAAAGGTWAWQRGRPTPAPTRIHYRCDLSQGAPEGIALESGSWEFRQTSTIGPGMAAEHARFILPVAIPDRPIRGELALIATNDQNNYLLGWADDQRQTVPGAIWRITTDGSPLITPKPRFYILQGCIALMDGEKLIAVLEYDRQNKSDTLFLSLKNILLTSIVLDEIAFEDVPDEIRDPRGLIEKWKAATPP